MANKAEQTAEQMVQLAHLIASSLASTATLSFVFKTVLASLHLAHQLSHRSVELGHIFSFLVRVQNRHLKVANSPVAALAAGLNFSVVASAVLLQ